jgi:1-acyl-sn-glycerol-3-phosphate acyltransferase
MHGPRSVAGRDDRLWHDILFPTLRRLIDLGYFSLTVRGAELVPREGQVLFVDNHAGWFPFDAFFLNLAISDHVGRDRIPYTATLDLALQTPVLGPILTKLGGLPASWFRRPERLPAEVQSCAMFPEGSAGNCKPFWNAYRMREWNRSFLRYALLRRALIVPVAIVGGEESMPVAWELKALKGWLGTAVPIPLAPVPLPTAWEIVFHAPIDVSNKPSKVHRELAEQIRQLVQDTLDERTQTRRLGRLSAFLSKERWSRGPSEEAAAMGAPVPEAEVAAQRERSLVAGGR